jgi:hypothetical protein
MAMPTLIEIKNNTAVAALRQIFLDGRICRLEFDIQKFDLQMQLVAILFDFCEKRRDVGFQRLDSVITHPLAKASRL